MPSGGKREGAGRPPKPDDEQRKPMTLHLPEAVQIEIYAEASLNGMTAGELVELWLGMFRRT